MGSGSLEAIGKAYALGFVVDAPPKPDFPYSTFEAVHSPKTIQT
jgi:hypothetical protein